MLLDKRLYNNFFCEWEVIPLYLIKKSLGSAIKLRLKVINQGFSYLSREIIFYWKKYLNLITNILPKHLWYNANIQEEKIPIQYSWFSKKNIVFSNFFMTMALLKMAWLFERVKFTWKFLFSIDATYSLFHKINLYN